MADPRLVETLSFHAVNGRRLKSSIDFFDDAESQWSLKLLCVSMEPTRALTWFWLSCLGSSLKAQTRPALYKILDPKTSVVIEALQHFSSLLMSSTGGGRLQLLWPCADGVSFGDWCSLEPQKCRSIRRLLMLGACWVFRRHHVYLNSDQFAITLCGDDNADPATLDNFLQFWGVKGHCCYPPGLCRDLKQMDVGADDLTSGNYKQLLFWLAATLQLSIADVESMHSQNRSLQGNSFAGISAKFINAETQRAQQEALKLQRTESKTGSGNTYSSMDGAGVKTVLKDTDTKTPKGLSALELFRKHHLQVRCTHESVNPCSKEMWQEVREAYGKLSSKERDLYQMMSQDSKALALEQRRRRTRGNGRQQAAKDNISANSVHHALESTASNSLVPHGYKHGVHLQTLPVHQLSQALDAPSWEVLEQNVNQRHVGKHTSFGTSEYPMGESMLDQVWRSQVRSGITGKASLKTFQRQSESLARPSDQSDVFPRRVVHDGYCGEQCRFSGDHARVCLHCNTLTLFDVIVTQNLDSAGD